jgi:hypothetical protein
MGEERCDRSAVGRNGYGVKVRPALNRSHAVLSGNIDPAPKRSGSDLI